MLKVSIVDDPPFDNPFAARPAQRSSKPTMTGAGATPAT
jgi:hypothetical protein